MNEQLLNTILHKLFKCPTFWQLRPTFQCPICQKRYRCYWDGSDIEDIGMDICNHCATIIEKVEVLQQKDYEPPQRIKDLLGARVYKKHQIK